MVNVYVLSLYTTMATRDGCIKISSQNEFSESFEH